MMLERLRAFCSDSWKVSRRVTDAARRPLYAASELLALPAPPHAPPPCAEEAVDVRMVCMVMRHAQEQACVAYLVGAVVCAT